MNDVTVKKGNLFGKGVFANKDFKKGEIIIKYHLKSLTKEEFEALPSMEKNFTHTHWGVIYLYSSPERYVNHSSNPNTHPNLKDRSDVTIRDIKKGEEITTDATKDDV
ncbi:MAG TPA: SET domain-containing protein [Candidatus Nanoarchaeia archaeon]|nr:SET domain-containing protein [Candidatus Nanoarchaeia archaeon]